MKTEGETEVDGMQTQTLNDLELMRLKLASMESDIQMMKNIIDRMEERHRRLTP